MLSLGDIARLGCASTRAREAVFSPTVIDWVARHKLSPATLAKTRLGCRPRAGAHWSYERIHLCLFYEVQPIFPIIIPFEFASDCVRGEGESSESDDGDESYDSADSEQQRASSRRPAPARTSTARRAICGATRG